MRPRFVDDILTEPHIEPEGTAGAEYADEQRERRYREWRRTRVLFMRAEAVADRACLSDDLPPQRTGTAL